MYQGELLLASGNNFGCTNHAVFSIAQRLSADRKSMHRDYSIEAQKLFNYDGEFKVDDKVDGVIRLEFDNQEAIRYFTGIIVYLSMGLMKIRLDSELSENNIEQFLKTNERYEFSR